MPQCSACNINKSPSSFSKSQLRKAKNSKRCKECIKNGIQIGIIKQPKQEINTKMNDLNNLSSSFQKMKLSTSSSSPFQRKSKMNAPNVSNLLNADLGQCHLMCPAKESSIRIEHNQFHKAFEREKNKELIKYHLIKEYTRSFAGQQINLKDVRCAATLRQTMDYLMNRVLNNTTASFVDRFSFLEDRIRAIIKDVYVQNLIKYDVETSIHLMEICVRFRIFSHLFLCHLDEEIIHFSPSTKYQSKFLKMDINENPKQNKFYYSSNRNLSHLSNIFNHLFEMYKMRKFDASSIEKQIEIYCLAAFHKLVHSQNCDLAKNALCNVSVPLYLRKHARIKMAMALLNTYNDMNKCLFFKIYQNKLSILEKAALYPMLDDFRLRCIHKMCFRKCVKMPPWNLRYSYSSFVADFGFYQVGKSDESLDAMDFLMNFGGFGTNEMQRIVETGLTMDDFAKLKRQKKDKTRFPARDLFLIAIDSQTRGMQNIIQSPMMNLNT